VKYDYEENYLDHQDKLTKRKHFLEFLHPEVQKFQNPDSMITMNDDD